LSDSANERYAAKRRKFQEGAMADAGAMIDGSGAKETARRAPLAAAAALAVLAGGAAFLAFAMSRPTLPPPQAAAETVEDAGHAVPRPEPRVPRPAPAGPGSPANVSDSNASGLSADETTGLEKFGGPPRINPARETPAHETLRTADASAPPRQKPPSGDAMLAPPAAATVLSLAANWLADDAVRPPPFFFESDITPDRTGAAASLHSIDGDISEQPQKMRIVLVKGETFVDALRRAGVRAEDRNQAAYEFGKLYNMRRLRPGQSFVMRIAEPNQTLFQSLSFKEAPPAYLLSLDFRVDPENRILLDRTHDGFAARAMATPLTTRIAAIEGRIDGSLYLSAKRRGAPDEVIAGLAQMFAYDVDFQREIFGGDEFEALFEVHFDDAGKMVGGGDILYGRLKWRGRQKEKGYYRFASADGAGRADYFDASGESARRLLMKTPIDGARLSSGFGTRKHPILGYQKAHKGVDFAAARGTPIMAAGDGVIERAGPYGSFGNYVRIRHAQSYKTAYAHMNSIKKGVRTGARVRQGDVIGYVGTTGRSTGPHLHYEVHLKDKPVNPQSLKIATGVNLGGKELARFREERDRINAMRMPHTEASAPLIARENKKDASL
jgi:murein DD-endopeptidase MepM/ murein hydrolase activator NlpD